MLQAAQITGHFVFVKHLSKRLPMSSDPVTLSAMLNVMRERRKTGRPPLPEHLKLGPGRFVRFPMLLDAAIELTRQDIVEECRARGEMRTVEISEAVRRLVQRGMDADGLEDRAKGYLQELADEARKAQAAKAKAAAGGSSPPPRRRRRTA